MRTTPVAGPSPESASWDPWFTRPKSKFHFREEGTHARDLGFGPWILTPQTPRSIREALE
jgi:hypothetical protein